MSLKHNKHFRRIAAALMAGTMMASMVGMTAFAEEGDAGIGIASGVIIEKTIEKGANVYTPDTSFTFHVEAAGNSEKANAGIGGAILNNDIVIKFSPSENEETLAEESISKSSEEGFCFDATKFPNAGIYHYVVTEAEGRYDGMSYDTAARDLYVYVENVMEDGVPTGGLQIAGYEMVKGGEKSKGFTNTYTTEEGPGPDGGSQSLTIRKEVTGNLGDLNRKFDFTITVSDNADGVEEMYYMVVTDKKSIETIYTLKDAVSQRFQLADGEKAVIYGLSASDTYTVVETTEDENYSTTVNGSEGKSVTDATAKEVPVVDFVNEYDMEIPTTGIVMNIAPYVLMVVLAGGLAFLFLRRRKNNF